MPNVELQARIKEQVAATKAAKLKYRGVVYLKSNHQFMSQQTNQGLGLAHPVRYAVEEVKVKPEPEPVVEEKPKTQRKAKAKKVIR